MKIAFLIRQLSTGGAEQQLIRTAAGFAGRGHEVTVFTFYGGGALAAQLAGSGVSHVDLAKSGRWDVISFVKRLADSLKSREVDVLYTFLPSANLIGGWLRFRDARLRLVCGVRASRMEDGSYDWLGSLVARIEDAALKRADVVISNSYAGVKRFVKWHSSASIHVVPNGIDAARYVRNEAIGKELRVRWGVPERAPLIGIVGRLDAMKGHEYALSAFSMLRKEFADAHMVIVGDGTTERLEFLRAETSRLGLHSRVIFAPAMQPVANVYSAIDVLCSSSIYGEGFSNVLCEGLLAGCRCVATDVGDASVIMGNTSYVAPPRDAAALTRTLKAALLDDAAGWAEARQRVATRFSTAAMLDRTEEILAALLRTDTPQRVAGPSMNRKS